MTTQYPSPGIIPPEITGAEYWQPTTHRIAYVSQPGIDTYRTICIERLGETYGRKSGARIPTCDEIDAPVGIVTTGTATPPPLPWTAPPAPPWSGWIPPGRGGPPDGPDTPVLPPFVTLIPPRAPREPETPTVYEPDMPPAPPPVVPLPAPGLTLILAILALTVIARRVN